MPRSKKQDKIVFLDERLGLYVRRGSLEKQQESTYDMCLACIEGGQWDDAATLARFTVQEATEPHELYRDWLPQIRNFLHARGVPENVVIAAERKILNDLRWDDGSPFYAETGWNRMCDAVKATVDACLNQDKSTAVNCINHARDFWLATHDRKCDWVQGMIAVVADQLGQMVIGELWDELMAPMFETYEKYDVRKTSWRLSRERLLMVSAEALRGHLSGPNRRGTVELLVEDGRKGFRFAPCGSGGRNFQPAARRFPVTDKEYDWAWNQRGVCLYCAHCCALSERNPIRRFGYPARVIEPPFIENTATRDHCTWWVYDDPSNIPEAVYRRTGNRKPKSIGSSTDSKATDGI